MNQAAHDTTTGGSPLELSAALRASAVAAADAAGGGVSLLFTSGPGGELQLRTAAGFPSAAAARTAAEALRPRVERALHGEPVVESADDALGSRGAGAVALLPLTTGAEHHGVLAVASPGEIDGIRLTALVGVAELAACRLEHDVMLEELTGLRSQADQHSRAAAEKSDEVLKLSEALFAQDIELLRNNEKLGKIEKLKNDFIEKMSRELRTPLNGIIEAVIAVLTGEDGRLSEEAKTGLRRALDDGTAFLRTLQNILDLWRIKQGELPVEITDVNFREVLDEALFSIQDAAEETSLEIVKELQDPFPKLRTDLAKLNQILFLLLDNAVKFTPGGRIEVRARIEGERLCCEVRDSGIGICPDDQQFIFDEFFQVDDTRSSRYGGSGLGLTLVRDLIVLLEGEVGVSSDVGRGTSVSFAIPVQRAG